MAHRHPVLHALILTLLLVAACSPDQAGPTAVPNLPNPASVYCEDNGGTLDLRTSESGAVAGVCVFPDGSECDEWQFFRGTCTPGAVVPGEASPTERQPSPDGEWIRWHNDALGFSFEYPGDAELVMNDDPGSGLSVVGPLVGGDHWPMFYLAYPLDREDYRPPEGTDLAGWLAEKNLMAEERLQDAQIAGTTAVHLRHDASPQSFAFDTYYFANAGQLYSVVIQHTGDREDWPLYTRFLDSFTFDR
jgi:putative hemolysin